MDFDSLFRAQIDTLKAEGNYRSFAELERKRGEFPRAMNHKDGEVSEITVWCSNDYLGMGQHPAVVKAMVDSVQACGTGSGGTRNISGNNHHHLLLEAELADLHGKDAALLFTLAAGGASCGCGAAGCSFRGRVGRRLQPICRIG